MKPELIFVMQNSNGMIAISKAELQYLTNKFYAEGKKDAEVTIKAESKEIKE